MKSQTPSTISQGVGCSAGGGSGFRCQESKKTKTCWSEAEIPSEAKRQRGTLLAAPTCPVVARRAKSEALEAKAGNLKPQSLGEAIKSRKRA
jgi:hypothetical protein